LLARIPAAFSRHFLKSFKNGVSMSDMKSGLRLLIGIALVAGTVTLAGCGNSDKSTSTTTTEQSTSTVPVAPTSTTTTTTSSQQSRP
jgi:ABC-type oligopeptide transport system substrate-binding subunit